MADQELQAAPSGSDVDVVVVGAFDCLVEFVVTGNIALLMVWNFREAITCTAINEVVFRNRCSSSDGKARSPVGVRPQLFRDDPVRGWRRVVHHI